MASKKTGWPKTYTTAKPEYDWFGTHTDKELVGWTKTSSGEKNKPIRSVRSDPGYVESQRQRYMSGNHMAVDEAEWKKLVGYKLVILAPKSTESLNENPNRELRAALTRDEAQLTKIQRDIRVLLRGGQVPNLTLSNAWRTEQGLVQAIANKKKLMGHNRENPYARKTQDEYILEGYYAHGWELLTAEESWKEIRERRKEYRENEPGTPLRIVKRRVPRGSAPLNENPSGGAVAAIIGLGVLVAGWVLLKPKKASAASAAPSQPALPPAQVQPGLPPPPEAKEPPAELVAAQPQAAAQIPEQLLTQTNGCDLGKIIQYNFKDQEPLIWTYRRLSVWKIKDLEAGQTQPEHLGWTGWLPTTQRGMGLYYGEFGDSVKKKAIDFYSTVYFLVEMWVWTTEGWCLDATTRNYTATAPAPVPETQASSQIINQPPQATNP